MEQVILLYCHTILGKKSFGISFVFIPVLRNNFISCNALSQMSRRIVSTPHQRHYSGYPLCSGVLKDCEALFSLNYVRLKNYLILRSHMLLLDVCYLQVLRN